MRRKEAHSINAYLAESPVMYVTLRSAPLCADFPPVLVGDVLGCGGHLVLSHKEAAAIEESYPDTGEYIRPLLTGESLMRGNPSLCLLLNEAVPDVPPIAERLKAVEKFRAMSPKSNTRDMAARPWEFLEKRHDTTLSALSLPRTMSGRREYVPAIMVRSGTVVTTSLHVLYDRIPEMAAVISSRLYALWFCFVGARHRFDWRHGIDLVYNTFPFPDGVLSSLAETGENLLRVRDSLGMPYGLAYREKMLPLPLLEAHLKIDHTIENIMFGKPCCSDTERLDKLLRQYDTMVSRESKGLFA